MSIICKVWFTFGYKRYSYINIKEKKKAVRFLLTTFYKLFDNSYLYVIDKELIAMFPFVKFT